MRIAWRRAPPKPPTPPPPPPPPPSLALQYLALAEQQPDDKLTLVLGWLNPQVAYSAAAVCHSWRASLAHARWRRILIVASRDPRPTASQLTAMLHPRCTSELEHLELRLVTAGSHNWMDSESRLLELGRASALRRLELTQCHLGQITEAVALSIASAGSLQEVVLGANLSARAFLALLCCPELRCLSFNACTDRAPETLPPHAARKLRKMRCEVKLDYLAWLKLFTPAPSAVLCDFELAHLGKVRVDLPNGVMAVYAFLDRLSNEVDLVRLRLPFLVCPLPANDAAAQTVVEAAQETLRPFSYRAGAPYAKVHWDGPPVSTNRCATVRVQYG